MLELSKKPCKILNINPRVEMHGDEKVPALDVKIGGVMLEQHELNALLGEPHAWAQLFNERSGKMTEPAFRCFGPIPVEREFEDCTVTMYLGLKLEMIELGTTKIKKLKIVRRWAG